MCAHRGCPGAGTEAEGRYGTPGHRPLRAGSYRGGSLGSSAAARTRNTGGSRKGPAPQEQRRRSWSPCRLPSPPPLWHNHAVSSRYNAGKPTQPSIEKSHGAGLSLGAGNRFIVLEENIEKQKQH